MALAGAIATLEWLHRQWKRARVVYVSDSEYLIKGMTEWVPGWIARGWRRKGGAIENLPLWQKLEVLDRKSTRLNSSHTVISYAVFCLKKKKKKKKKLEQQKTKTESEHS